MQEPERILTTRRTFVFLGLLAVAGCTTGRSQQSLRTPEPVWPEVPPPPPTRVATDARPIKPVTGAPGVQKVAQAGSAAGAGGAAVSTKVPYGAKELRKGPVPFALTRGSWAQGSPVVKDLNPMLPPRWITVHHDGMDAFYGTDLVEVKMRLERIRNGALSREGGWGDIPYHFVIDREGRVWEGRQLRFQGAHVRSCNEHNVGVMCLGNFQEQKPSEAQIAGLQRTLTALRGYYRIPATKVRTHREWPTAHTECPGDALQARMASLRKSTSRKA